MNRKEKFFGILFLILLLIFMVFLICGAVLLILGEAYATALILGLSGLLGFSVVLGGAVLLGRRRPKIDDETQAEKLHELYVSLVDNADIDPDAFTRKLNRLCRLGNIYVFLLLALILLSIGGNFIIHVYTNIKPGVYFGLYAGGMLVMACVLIESFYVKIDPPDMPTVSRKESPLLFELIDEASAGTSSRRMDMIYLSLDAGCSVTRIPVGFKSRDSMCVGIYLFGILTMDELRSVFSHEFAHISNKDTIIGEKATKNLTRWENISTAIERKGFIPKTLLGTFAQYYTTRLSLHLSAISKQKEYLADKTAAEHVSPEIFAATQAKLEIMNLFISETIGPNSLEIRDSETPPENHFNLLFSAFYRNYDKKKTDWLLQIKKRMSTKYDSHPTFTDRLRAVGIEDFITELSFEHDNSDYQNEVDEIIAKMNSFWAAIMADVWGIVREGYLKSLEAIDSFIETDDEDKLLEYGMALENTGDEDSAVIVYDKVLKSNPENAGALFRKGQILLTRNNEEGLDLIISAVDLDNDFIENGLSLIGNYLVANGMADKKDELKEWALKKSEIHMKKQDEINNLYSSDRFLPCDLDDETVEKIKSILLGIKYVSAAYLVKKDLKHTVGDYYVLGVELGGFLSLNKRQTVLETITEEIDELDFGYYLLDLQANRSFGKAISLINNSAIF